MTRTTERGFSLLETCVALLILMVVLIGLMPLAALATKYTENDGHLAARATEYAQDKMEQLLVLSWGDTVSNTAVFPTQNSGGTGLAVGGSMDPSAPAAGYVDWLDASGNLLTVSGVSAPTGWFYKRVWQISSVSTHVKQITSTVIVRSTVGGALVPRSTLSSLRTEPF
jgi:type II secretory pathway pseudopilin PulG